MLEEGMLYLFLLQKGTLIDMEEEGASFLLIAKHMLRAHNNSVKGSNSYQNNVDLTYLKMYIVHA